MEAVWNLPIRQRASSLKEIIWSFFFTCAKRVAGKEGISEGFWRCECGSLVASANYLQMLGKGGLRKAHLSVDSNSIPSGLQLWQKIWVYWKLLTSAVFIATPKKTLQGTFYYIHDCLHLTVLPLLVTFTTYYTQNLLFKGYVRALGNFSHCVGVCLSSEQRLHKLERRQNPWLFLPLLVTHIIIQYKMKPYLFSPKMAISSYRNSVYGLYVRECKINGKKKKSSEWTWWPPAQAKNTDKNGSWEETKNSCS